MKNLFIAAFIFVSVSVSGMTKEQVAVKYGTTMSSSEIQSIISSITWETNDQFSVLGSDKAVKGGIIKYALQSYPPTLRTEGKNSSSTFNSLVAGMIYEIPLGLDPVTSKYVPGLADKWAVSQDRKTYYLHFDERARWRDGFSVTAYDYVATWDLLTSEDLEEPFTKAYWEKFERPVALTSQILMIKAKELEWRLFLSAAAGLNILPAHVLGDITPKQYMTEYELKMLPGSGPYYYDSSKTNEYIVLKRNPDWWGKDLEMNRGQYNFDQLKFVFFEDDNLIIETFKKGELDFYYCNVARRWHQEFIADQIPAIKNNWIIRQRIYTDAPVGLGGITFNLREKPFDDIRVRKAFCMLYNREKFMDKLFFNEYTFKDSFYPNSPYANPDNPKVRFNPDEATLLLDEAGWSQASLNDEGFLVRDGKVFELDLNLTGNDDRVESIFKEDLAAVGIKLNLKKVTWATHIKDMNQRNFKIAESSYAGNRFPNPEGSFHSKYADLENTGNIYGYKNARVDEICEQYNVEFDFDKRVKLLQELDGILMKEYIYALNWYQESTRMLYWNKFGVPGYVLSRYDSASYLYSILSYWWNDPEKEKKLLEAKKNSQALPAEPAEIRYWKDHKKDYQVQ